MTEFKPAYIKKEMGGNPRMEYWVLYRWHPHSVEMDKLWYTTYAKAAKAIKWYQNTPVEEQIIFFGE